ncbi:MAG: zinc-binding dehydrogenase, partial [Chloroflexi bacterium]|nr:zinc-binding dehydrogenase [Chloroflexota bacterium]
LSYSGICGKQLEEMDGRGGSDPYLPHLLGHEGSGQVIDVGPAVRKVIPGDTVVLHWRKGSGIDSASPLYTRNEMRVNAGWVTTFNEFSVVAENRVTAIPHDSDLLVAALLGCAVTTGVGVIFNAAAVQPHDTVVIYGCGGVGLCAIQAARLRHPRHLIAVDVNQQALTLAKEFGASELINPLEMEVIKRVREITAGRGASKVIVCSGQPQAIETAIETTSIPGECILVGVPPKDSSVRFVPHAVMHERTLRGSLGGDSFPDRDIPAYLALHREGHLRLDRLVSRVEPFDNINKLIEEMQGETPGRCVIKF